MTEQPNGWAALMAFFSMISAIGVIVGPILAQRRDAAAKAAADKREVKLDEVHKTVANTETLVNGKSNEQERRIAELEAHIENLERPK